MLGIRWPLSACCASRGDEDETRTRHALGLGRVLGVLSFLVGLMIIAGWPATSFFVLGLFLGMDLIFIGTMWIAMGLALKNLA